MDITTTGEAGVAIPLMQITLQDVIVTSVRTSGAESGDGMLHPMEVVEPGYAEYLLDPVR